MISTAEITPPLMPKRWVSGGSCGPLPRRAPPPPEPDRSRRPMPFAAPFAVDRMIGQERLRGAHEREQPLRAVATGHVRGDFLVGDVVRRRGGHFFFAAAP